MFESVGPVSPDEIINKLANGIVKRRLSAPIIMFLESVKPMNYLGSQLMIFLEPVVLAIFNVTQYREIALILEERGSIERILTAIERIDDEDQLIRKEEKRIEKEKKDKKKKKDK